MISKKLIKQTAVKHGIPTAKFYSIDFKKATDIHFEFKQIKNSINFPIFVKPDQGAGSCGTKKITNDADLMKWLEANFYTDMVIFLRIK